MKIFNVYTFPGKERGEDSFRRVNKLLASPNSIIQAPEFAMGVVVLEPGHGHEVHQHSGNREICVVLEGEAVFKQSEDDAGTVIRKGDFFGFNFDEPHGFWNVSDETFYMLWCYYPPGQAEEKFLIPDIEKLMEQEEGK
ncbi:MAG: cupin domain-containing protein [Lachnospiraceae bacterium]|nr:cupin domain-containing protein [Lachnospiraceae bacterium]